MSEKNSSLNDYGQFITGLKIKSIHADELKDYLDCKGEDLKSNSAMLTNSLFLQYMMKHGLKYDKANNSTNDCIMMKFKYGTDDISSSNLRVWFYENTSTVKYKCKRKKTDDGQPCYLNPITYKMLMRSPSKAKEGDCLFIKESLWETAIKWLSIDLFHKMPTTNANIVAMSAYMTLPTATMVATIPISPEELLIVKDIESFCEVYAVSVKCKDVEHIRQVLDFKAMETQANESGYTFYRKKQSRDGLILIEKKGMKSLADKLIEIEDLSGIKIDLTLNEKNIPDIKAMESPLNSVGYSFYKKKCSYKGFTLIDQSEDSVNEKGITPIYKDRTYTRNECYVDRHIDENGNKQKIKVKNTIHDGMGVIDHSMMPKGMEGFIYCRSLMSKICFFDGEVVQFFKDRFGAEYDTATVKDMFGNDVKVSNIRAITTDNGVKFLKFKDLLDGTEMTIYKHWVKKMEENQNLWGIVKSAHKSKYGDLQRGSYQMYGSLPTTDDTILKQIAQPTIDYINSLKTDDVKFAEYLRVTNTSYSINSMLLAMMNHSANFVKTDWYKTQKTQIIHELKDRSELGKLYQIADNLTICGNPYALLLNAVGDDYKNDKTLLDIEDGVQCYTEHFKNGEYLAGFRSPHNSPNNVIHLQNHYHPIFKQYFPHLGKNVIVINMINTPTQDRLNGQDEDSDFVFVTNQPQMTELAKKCFEDYPTIINEIPKLDSAYNNTMHDFAMIDNKIAANQMAIGWSSNLSQLALSYYYDKLYHNLDTEGAEQDGLKQYEDIFIIGSVLAQVAIDSAKREYEIKPVSELLRISRLGCMGLEKKYPAFYAEIQRLKAKKDKKYKYDAEKLEARYEEITSSIISECKCPMQILSGIIDTYIYDGRGKNRGKSLKFEYMLLKEKYSKDESTVQADKIEALIAEYDKQMNQLNTKDKDYTVQADALTKGHIRYIKRKYNIEPATMRYLIRRAMGWMVGKDNNTKYQKRQLVTLFAYDSEMFLNCFKKLKQKKTEKVSEVA